MARVSGQTVTMSDHEYEGPKEADSEREQLEPVESGGLEGEQPDKGYGADEGEREQALGDE